ncbi:MAG: efflux transporter outer membrane subunit [Caulobacteraceae bacterium]
MTRPFSMRRERPLPKRLGVAALATALLAGCTMAPTYERPVSPVPAALPAGGAYGAAQPAQTAAADLGWRDFFSDPKLQQVIQLALNNNRDLRVAVLNIAEAHAQYRIQRAALVPHVGANFDPTIEHLPASVLGAESGVTTTTATTSTAQAVATSNQAVTLQIYEATLGVSNYELDLWGRVRSLSRQALELYLATEEARRAEQISLISQVATAYVTYAADLERLNVAKQTVEADQNSLNITTARANGGLASDLDVRQAQSALEQARAGIATYTTTVAQDVNVLTLLVGAPVPAELLPDPLQNNMVTLSDLPAGLSSDVLLRRPDVMEAEHQLKGYNANIGAARAAFFPTIELTGGGGSASVSIGSLFGPATGAWTFTPTVTLPIFSGGQNAANLRYAKVEKNVAVAQYEKAVQTAFREVADALAQKGQIADLVSANERETDAISHSFGLSSARYQRGTDTYLNVLNSQVTLYSAQQNLISARLTRATNLIDLYQALGGGVK